jgi:hypothetical protein
MLVKLRVVKVNVVSLAVRVLVCFVVEEPYVGGVLDFRSGINLKRVCSLARESRGSGRGQVVVHIPFMGVIGSIGEVIPLELSGLCLERTC